MLRTGDLWMHRHGAPQLRRGLNSSPRSSACEYLGYFTLIQVILPRTVRYGLIAGLQTMPSRSRLQAAIWLSEDPHHAASRRLASEPQTRAPAVSARRTAGAVTHSATQAAELVSCSTSLDPASPPTMDFASRSIVDYGMSASTSRSSRPSITRRRTSRRGGSITTNTDHTAHLVV